MEFIINAIVVISDWVWSYPLMLVLVGGGTYLLFYAGFAPFAYFRHAIGIMQGKYDLEHEQGDISHYQALSSAIAATVGMGNISGVAIAIATGGPGAVFWMWVCAVIGMASKFFECSLAIMYRETDAKGQTHGGPMYYMKLGLGKWGTLLGVLFSIFGLIGCLPLFTANQLTEALRYLVFVPMGVEKESFLYLNLGIGIGMALLSALVILGGIKRIGNIAGYLFPVMVGAYLLLALWALGMNFEKIPAMFALIFYDAFTATSVQGGLLGSLIVIGVRRAAFSNEAGLGTSPMMHGAAKTQEPIREGLVAMLGPFVDTIVICTITALLIILAGVWQGVDKNQGIHITALALDKLVPVVGRYILLFCALIFALTTLFSYSYYGSKCFVFLFGQKYQMLYAYFYLFSIVLGAVSSLSVIISLIDLSYALMALVNMPVVLYLSPKVKQAMKVYFAKMKA